MQFLKRSCAVALSCLGAMSVKAAAEQHSYQRARSTCFKARGYTVSET